MPDAMASFPRLFAHLVNYPPFSLFQPNTLTPDLEKQMPLIPCTIIERFPNGYPRFAAFLSSSDSFLIFRRFMRLRARILLTRQNRIEKLEGQLRSIDEEEQWPTWHATCQYDGNAERRKVLLEAEEELLAFDRLVRSTSDTLNHGDAQSRDINSLKNWLDGNGCVTQEETTYLYNHRDLFSVAPASDNAMASFESWVEDRLIQLPWYRKRNGNEVSEDPRVHNYSGMTIRRLAMALLISLVTIMILLPIIICNIVTATAMRIVIVMLSTVFYLLILSGLTQAKTTDLVMAATTYATVLIVFVSGTG